MVRAGRTAVVLLITAVLGVVVGVALVPAAHAQLLQVELTEDPFVCDGGTRVIGTVDGFSPGERVEFRSPQIDGGLDGIFSTREADDLGVVEMKWSCEAPKVWEVSVTGRTSNLGVTFTIDGVQAPPPPDAPLGAAFDAKTAMTAGEMAIWKDFSPYNGVGIYMPVDEEWDNRADKDQANLTPSWVETVLADGWRILPIYVGRQAPRACAIGSFHSMSSDPGLAREQGLAAASDAAASMEQLGIAPGAPIYYDLESYRPGCTDAILAFLDAWTEGVRASGYVSGVYGSQNSAMSDLTAGARTGLIDLPDAIWVSTNSGVAGTLGLEAPPDDLWTNARIHQYRLSVTRTYGGVTLEVDDNIVDAPVATYRPPVVDNDGDGHAEPEPDNCDSIANPDQADLDGDGDGDVCDRDRDGDGFDDPSPDNCDLIANPDQADLDGDGDGDVCDSDIDGDGLGNDDDPAPADASIPAPAPEPTAVPEATPVPEATAAVETAAEDESQVAIDAQATPTPDSIPVPSVEPSATPQAVVLLPPTVEPLDAASEDAAFEDDNPALPTVPADAEPTGSTLESATVTIQTEQDDGFDGRTLAIALSAVAAVAFAGMAAWSWRRS